MKMSRKPESEDEFTDSEEETEEETEEGSEEYTEEDDEDDDDDDDDDVMGDRYSSANKNNKNQDDFNLEESDEEDSSRHSGPTVSTTNNNNSSGSSKTTPTTITNTNFSSSGTSLQSQHPSRQGSANNRNIANVVATSSRVNSASYLNPANRTGSATPVGGTTQRVTSAAMRGTSARSTVVKNQPFDEVFEAETESDGNTEESGSEEEEEEGEEEEEEEEDDTDEELTKSLEYNPKDYEQLPVSSEIKQLFAYISAYKPQDIELDTKLKPFIPDYIAAVGELDPFLKVPRPDGKPDYLGLKVLDEPAADQSDPTVVTLNISYRDTKASNPIVVINSVEQADKNPKRIQKWVEDIRELHKTKPPPTVNYSKNMPDINHLMQAWPEQFEEMLNTVELPGADVDLDLAEYVKFICTVLDVPVYANPIESLHLLFTLYLEFKANQHFSQQMDQ